MGLLLLLGIGVGIGAFAFKKGEKAAVEKELEHAAKKPLKIHGTEPFDHLLGLFAGGERTELKTKHPELVNKAKAIISAVSARAERGVFPAITSEQLSALYNIARTPGPSLDKNLGSARGDVTEPLEFLGALILGPGYEGVFFKKATDAEKQAIKVMGATINNRWMNKVAPPVTKDMLKTFYSINMKIRSRI